MKKFFYDLHIHSCLSPCADNDMTVNNISGMAKVNGLNIAALTDHNTTKNCPAFIKACERNGIVGVAGTELTTAEDIHLICLFEKLEDAVRFDRDLQQKRILIKNRPEVAGEQLILDEFDKVIGTEEHFLPNATTLSLEEAYDFACGYNAAVYPAHIDRTANGIVAVLGVFPDKPPFTGCEFRDKRNDEAYSLEYPLISGLNKVFSSDAHYLWDISEAENYIRLSCDENDADSVRKALIEHIRSRQL